MPVDVEQLVKDHKKAVSTVDGLEFHTAPGLLEQLRGAVFGSGAPDGAGGGRRSKLPMQAAALDLYQLIDRQVSEAWAAAFKRVPGVESVEALLSEWAAWVDPDMIVEVTRPATRLVDGVESAYSLRLEKRAEDLVRSWEYAIQDYFVPPRDAEIPLPCIACGERYVHRHVDGQTIRSGAWVFVRDRESGATLRAECNACQATWGLDRFDWLAQQLGIDVEKKKREHEEAELERERKHAGDA